MPLFVIALLVFAVAIAVVLTARLVRSYPLGFAGLALSSINAKTAAPMTATNPANPSG